MLILNPISLIAIGALMLILGTTPTVAFTGYLIISGALVVLIHSSLNGGK